MPISLLSLLACSSPQPPADVATDNASDIAVGPTDGGTEAGDAAAPEDVVIADVPPRPASVAHCMFEPVPPTARAGTMVSEGSLRAGVGESVVELPVGTVQGGYQGRSSRTNAVDVRDVPSADVFMPSVGIETRPKARALALTAGDETVIFVKLDAPFFYESVVSDVERALGAEFNGKVIVTTSHSHGAMAQFSPSPVLSLGFGRFQTRMYRRVVDAITTAARAALAGRVDARVGFAHNGMFDPMDQVNRDRRPENDMLMGGRRKDRDLFVLRVDGRDGAPLALVNVFGIHGTVLGQDNAFATNEITGAIERAVEESFDRRVLVMHWQGAAGDVSPSGNGMMDCSGMMRSWQCNDFARMESVGRVARDAIRTAWTQAGTGMRDSLAIEAVTKSVSLGPDWSTFSVRQGANRLEYAPFRARRLPDGMIFDGMRRVLSPIDEFNAPHGAGLCGSDSPSLVPMATLPGVSMLLPYRSCIDVQRGALFVLAVGNIETEETPFCTTTRTQLSAVRLGDVMIATLPGEPVTMLADELRRRSPLPADRTIVVGYSQGHVGYLLTPEDWLLGGYEPNINLWGPLEGEYLVERSAELMALANTPMREDAAATGTTRLASPMNRMDTLAAPDATPTAGTVPTMIPSEVFVRGRRTLTSAQPSSRVPRLGLATFVWIGDDPQRQNPRIRLERETAPMSGTFEPVRRRSGREVVDGDVLLSWTPQPLRVMGATPRTHYWVAEWQAVTPWGTDGLDEIADRAGVALGRYRFHVEGSGWTLDSQPFEVTEGTMAATATRTGTTIAVTAGYEARDGWRLIDERGPQNRRVPLRRGPLRVTFEFDAGAPREETTMTLDAMGGASFDLGMQADRVRRVIVRDRFNNRGDVTL